MPLVTVEIATQRFPCRPVVTLERTGAEAVPWT